MARPHESARQPSAEPRELVFEGGAQETVEILPDVETLSAQQREQGVIAGVGRTRVDRRVPEGQQAASVPARAPDPERESLLVTTYKLATYYTLSIASLGLVVAVGWVVVGHWGF